MSTDMIRMDGVYCALCDEYFFDKRQRAEHIMNSNDHPECWRCGRRFLNGQILRRVSFDLFFTVIEKLTRLYDSTASPH